MPGLSESIEYSMPRRRVSTSASGSVDSRMSLSSRVITSSKSISSCAGQSASLSLRNSHWQSWMWPSSMMTWRTPLGYSMSSRRLKGRQQALRMWRCVIGSRLPLTRW